MRNSTSGFVVWPWRIVATCVLVGCAAGAQNTWIRPGDNRPVSCLGVQYQFGPYPEWRVTQEASIYARILEGHTPALLAFNGVESCGVGPIGVDSTELRGASHVLVLRSSARKPPVEPTSITLLVEMELVDRSSNEVVFRGLADAPVGPNEAMASKLIAEALNSLSRAGFVSIPNHKLRYETDVYRGRVITE